MSPAPKEAHCQNCQQMTKHVHVFRFRWQCSVCNLIREIFPDSPEEAANEEDY